MPLKTITSLSHPDVKMIRGLELKKNRDESELFMVEGLRHVEEALKAGWKLEIFAFAPDAKDDAVTRQALAAAKQSFDVTPEILQKMTGRDNAQPALGVFHKRLLGLKDFPMDKAGLWVALEQIRDPGNLGIIRTADAVKADGVVLIGNSCDPFAVDAVRATMGSFARVPVYATEAADFTAWKKSWKGSVIGTHLQTDTDYRKADYKPPLMILMGGESNGLSDTLAKACDTLVKIPMSGGTESLNLAVCTGIMLYEARRQSL